MALAVGERLGPYEILGLLGAGGMGEVYRARDSRLNRDVALKVSRSRFNERFTHEARAVAALNHPNICSLFDVGPDYLVMELVEGVTLAERVAKGPVPVDEAMDIARQIAAGLEAAHEKGITHRDLKPANIKITPDGLVKVLDFGLAKVQRPAEPVSNPADSPTLTMQATQAGMILGTAGYMSPEQARGEVVDKRADIWAFGVVLHEMLTAKTLFRGATVADTLAAVLVKPPDLDGVPARMRPLVAACVERNLKKRLRDIGEVWRFLEAAPVIEVKESPRPAVLPWAVAAIALAALGALGYWLLTQPKTVMPLARFEVLLPEGGVTPGLLPFSISPDGTQMAFASSDRLWLRKLDSGEWRPLASLNIGNTLLWSLDGRFIVFRSGENLVRMETSGGSPQVICSLSDGVFTGGFWTKDDQIVFGVNGVGIKTVSASGGAPAVLLPEGQFPSPLSNGTHFVYTGTDPAKSGVYVASLKEPRNPKRIVAEAVNQAVYAPMAQGGGHLLYVRGSQSANKLVAQKFDEQRLETVGEPAAVAERVPSSRGFAASRNGILLYREGEGSEGDPATLTWFDRQGRSLGAIEKSPLFGRRLLGLATHLSPDGARMTYRKRAEGQTADDLWIHEFARGVNTRFTDDGASPSGARWSADGGSIYFSGSFGRAGLYRKAAFGASEAELLFRPAANTPFTVNSVSGDGRFVLFTLSATGRLNDSHLWVLPIEGPKESRKPVLYLQTKFGESEGGFFPSRQGSPKWVTYTSPETGRNEIFVRPFDPSNRSGTPVGEKWQVSRDGGANPQWRADGKEIFFSSPDGNLMAADVLSSDGASFRTGPAKVLFNRPRMTGQRFAVLEDVSADGKRFIFSVPDQVPGDESVKLPPLKVLLHWQGGL